jgi:hypothetical protein
MGEKQSGRAAVVATRNPDFAGLDAPGGRTREISPKNPNRARHLRGSSV